MRQFAVRQFKSRQFKVRQFGPGATVYAIVDALALADVASANRDLPGSNALTLGDIATAQCVFHFAIVDAMALTQGAFGSTMKESACAEDYIVALGTRTQVTLTYPYVSPSLTLELRNPKFGNSNDVKNETIFRRTTGNQLIGGRIATWPVTETFKCSFEALTQAQRDAFLALAVASSGMEVGFLDQEDRQWRGVLISPFVDVAQRSRICDYVASFEFRGKLA